MTKQRRKSVTAKTKSEIMRDHFSNDIEVSAICEKYEIQPIQFYRWKKELFENAELAFETKKRGPVVHKISSKVDNLESKIKEKDSVIAELLEDHMKLKKKVGAN